MSRAVLDLASGPPSSLVRFPPGRGNVCVPTSPPRAAAAGIALYTAHSRRAWLAQWGCWLTARAGAASLLPGDRTDVAGGRPPLPDLDGVEDLWAQWCALLGGPLDGVACYERPQTGRPAAMVLLVGRGHSLVVRLRPDDTGPARERAIARAADRRAPHGFQVPRLRGAGEHGGWHWVAHDAVRAAPHRVDERPAELVAAGIADLVERALPRPDVPAHWRGCHGDLAPWNTMRLARTSWLVDWEDAGWAPPGFDEVTLAVTRAARGRRQRPGAVDRHPEAAAQLRDRVAERIDRDGPTALNLRLLHLLTPREPR